MAAPGHASTEEQRDVDHPQRATRPHSERSYGTVSPQASGAIAGNVPDLLVGVTDASLLNLVAGQVQRAHTWGIDTPEGVIQFIALGVLVSPTFDEHPAVRRFLNAPDLDPDFKISVLSQLTTKKLRELSQ